ncbi:hypothetical protein LDENG_00076310 [Lucifuga dentata]|nr:hypothetical protein LDENG_00076310 [Lucifuga dentata]
MHVFGSGRKPEHPCGHRENMQTPHRKALPQPGIEPRTFLGIEPRTFLLWGNSANHCTTVPPPIRNQEGANTFSWLCILCLTRCISTCIKLKISTQTPTILHNKNNKSHKKPNMYPCTAYISQEFETKYH